MTKDLRQKRKVILLLMLLVSAILISCCCATLLLFLNNQHRFTLPEIFPLPSPVEPPVDSTPDEHSPSAGQGIDEANPQRCEIKEISRTCTSCNIATVTNQLVNCQTEIVDESDTSCNNLCSPPAQTPPPPPANPPIVEPPTPEPPLWVEPGAN